MYFNNFMFTIGLLLLLAQHLFSFFVIPHGYDRSDTLISARNKQARSETKYELLINFVF